MSFTRRFYLPFVLEIYIEKEESSKSREDWKKVSFRIYTQTVQTYLNVYSIADIPYVGVRLP